MSKQKRETASYIESVKQLAKFAPSLKKYKRRKKLRPAEKGAITRKENLLRFHTQTLFPVNKKLAKELKGQLFAPGIHAIEFRNTAPNAKIHKVGQDLVLTSNGRTFLYWRLDREDVKSTKGMAKAAAKAFDIDEYEEEFGDNTEELPPDLFPIERVAELAGLAFEQLKPLAVYLWAPSGRVGSGFESLKQFSMWLAENWHADRYTQQEKWVNGIAILLNDPNFRKPFSTMKPFDPDRDPRKPPKKRKRNR